MYIQTETILRLHPYYLSTGVDKAISVPDSGGPWLCESSGLPRVLENRIRSDSNVK
jgi:hypothetical protein